MGFFMNLLVLTVFILLCASGQGVKELGDEDKGCTRGTYRLGDNCYTVLPISVTFENAELICETGGGILAPVKDRETHYFLQKLRIRKFMQRYWIGLNDREKEGTWVFADGSRLQGFTRWHRGEPNNMGGNQHCACMSQERHLYWDDNGCDNKFLFLCQFEGPEKCFNTTLPSLGQYCFYFSKTIATYEEADMECKTKGGLLAMPKTQAIHDLLRVGIYADRFWLSMDEKEVDSYLRMQSNYGPFLGDTWLGVKYDPQEGYWFYADGTRLNYSMWSPGEPNNNRGQEDCAKLGLGDWQDMQCDFRFNFACRYDAIVLPANDSDEPPILASNPKALYALAAKGAAKRIEPSSNIRLEMVPFLLIIFAAVSLGIALTGATYGGFRLYRKRFSIGSLRMEDETESLQDVKRIASVPETFIYRGETVTIR